jgi:hypothetical protein
MIIDAALDRGQAWYHDTGQGSNVAPNQEDDSIHEFISIYESLLKENGEDLSL